MSVPMSAAEMRALTLFLTLLAASTAAGCNTHQCDPSTVVLGQGQSPLGATTTWGDDGQIQWQSNSVNEPWLDFPGQRTYVLHFPQPFASPPEIGFDIAADPTDAQASFVVGAANLAQFSAVTTTSVTVLNPSCAEYGLRVIATGSRAVSVDAGDPDSGDGASTDSTSD